MSFTLPDLPYSHDALEPNMDKATLEIHHGKHHAAYTAKFNAAIEGTELENKSAEEIFANISKHSNAVRNNGGGYWNHCMFWEMLSPNGGGEPTGELANDINSTFGSFDNFKAEFSNAAATQFGSGWAWLILADGKLKITQSANQENPLMDDFADKGTPIMVIDVWEHAYYLHYQNRRPDFISAFWNMVNWDNISKRYQNAK